MTSALVKVEYQGTPMSFDGVGWFNATKAAKKWGKRVDHWLANQDTKDYLAALAESDPNTRLSGYMKTKRGAAGGTWLHPCLAIRFAQWLDAKFAVWCDKQIAAILRGGVTLYQQRLAFEARQRESMANGSHGGRLLNQRKREKPALEVEAASWKTRMEPGLFGPGPA